MATHITVLKTEAVELLAIQAGATVLDCTLGAGGHSREILKKLATGRLVSLDADQTALDAFDAGNTSATHELVCANFKDVQTTSLKLGISSYDAILADLGWRSEQFEAGQKGFSFLQDEPLLMTYGDPEQYDFTAYDIVNTWEESSIADVIYGYGGERAARKIAKAIVTARNHAEIKSSQQLADLLESTIGHFYRRTKIHPATKTFQALRIAVNDELGALKTLLHDGFSLLAPGGRLAIISFHSLEDRLVKQTFKQLAHDQQGMLVTKKPVTPTEAEVNANPRARSAKLRVIEKHE